MYQSQNSLHSESYTSVPRFTELVWPMRRFTSAIAVVAAEDPTVGAGSVCRTGVPAGRPCRGLLLRGSSPRLPTTKRAAFQILLREVARLPPPLPRQLGVIARRASGQPGEPQRIALAPTLLDDVHRVQHCPRLAQSSRRSHRAPGRAGRRREKGTSPVISSPSTTSIRATQKNRMS